MLRPSYWLKCQTPSDWSTAHPSPNTLLLHYTHYDGSTAHPSLTTLLLAYPPSYWLIRPLIGLYVLLLAYTPSYWLITPLIAQ